MAGVKRKGGPEALKANGISKTKKPKVALPPANQSSGKGAKPGLAENPDDLEESDTTDDEDFSGFSGDETTESSIVDGEVSGGEGDLKAAQTKIANSATEPSKAKHTTNGGGNCKVSLVQKDCLSLLTSR